jgi:hypothetical protein
MQMERSDIRITQDIQGAVPVEADYSPFMRFDHDFHNEEYAYHNAASCPDCSGGMIRQGRCCVCPSCGFESCLI